jgi:D-glycero-alpha-D-manno-heptose 1-phosphate guanylyltransferase
VSADPISGGFTAAVLAGGSGTRLRPVLSDRPKPLAPIGGRPFLFFLLDQLVACGADRIVMCTGHLGDQIRAAVGDRYGRCPVIYSHETSPLGTAGAVRAAMHCCDDNLWLIANGDSYIATALGEFVSWYRLNESNGAMLLTWAPDAIRFGTVELAETGLIRTFQARGRAVPGWINAGIYLLPRARIEKLPEQVSLSLENEVFPRWAQEGLAAYCVEAPFIDIGTPDSLRRAAQFFTEALETR